MYFSDFVVNCPFKELHAQPVKVTNKIQICDQTLLKHNQYKISK